MVAFGRMARRAVSEARARREIVAEARRRRAARASFEQTFEATVPLELDPAQLRPAVFERRASRVLAALELALLIAVAGGLVAGALFGAGHVLGHALAHFHSS